MAAHETARVTRASRVAQLHGIYLIVNESGRALTIARSALDAGIRIIQYRAKSGVVPDRLRELRALTREYQTLLIVNDDCEAAVAFDCDGIHLGPDDRGFAHVAQVRATLGDRLIGLSCGTVEEARRAEDGGADYIGVGSVYATASKADAGAPIGVEGLLRVAAATSLPVAAIGGITIATLREVRQTGVAMAAVISAIADAAHPAAAAREFMAAWSAA